MTHHHPPGWFAGGAASTQELVQPPEASLARSLFVVAALRLVLVSAALLSLVTSILLHPPTDEGLEDWQFYLIGSTYALSVLYLLLLRDQRLVRGLAYSQIGLDALLVSVLVVMTHGVESPFVFGYVFVVLSASITLFRSGAMLAASTCIVFFGSIMVLHAVAPSEFLAPLGPRVGNYVLSYLGLSAGMIGVAFLASALAEKARATTEKLAEKELDLEQLNHLQTAILRSLPAGVLAIDDLGRVRFGNDAAFQILRIADLDVVGRHIQDVVPPMAPAWSRMRDSHFREVGQSRFEEDFVRFDGELIRVGFSVAPLDFESELNAIIVFQDVTDIVRLKDLVARSERLASVGRFAAGLAHEVRNPLASMCASIDVLRTNLEPPEGLSRMMDNITREAERLNSLISDFLTLARPRALHLERQPVGPLVEEVLDMFQQEIQQEAIQVVRSIDSDVEADVDPDLMKQVVLNLVRNSREALKERGSILTVEVQYQGPAACICVRDDGPGVDQHMQAKVFDPFFTTKEEGSGLGLAITNSIVEAHGAHLHLESAPGAGTSVTIRFEAALGVGTSNLPTPNLSAVSNA